MKMHRSFKSDNSGDENGDDSFDSDEQVRTAIEQQSPFSASKMFPTSSAQGLPSLQLFRSESNSKKPVAGDLRAHKSQTLEVLTEMLAIESDESNAVPGFDPRRWIVAAGLLEKRRDGMMREGWAKRFFVLGKSALYYFLLPRVDMTGHVPLLGDERGCIKLSDVQEVRSDARDSNYWYITVTVSGVRKSNASQYFNNQVCQLQLRTPAESGQLWLDAITKARDDARKNGANSPGKTFASSTKRIWPPARDPLDTMSNASATTPVAASSLTQHASSADEQSKSPSNASATQSVHPSASDDHLRLRRDSKNIRAMDLVPIDQSFPLARPMPRSIFVLGWLGLLICAYPSTFKVEEYLPPWLIAIPPLAFLFDAVVLLLVYVEISRRVAAHDHVAREAKLRVGVMREELSNLAKLAETAPHGDGEKLLLPATSSEIARVAEEFGDVDCEGKHQAGLSTKNMVEPMKPGVHFMCWSEPLGSHYKLRIGPNYKKNNLKAPSGDPLYSLVALDLLRSKDRICNVGASDRVELPAYRPGVDPSLEDIKKSGLPRLFIVNAQIPEKAPTMFGKGADDSGYSLVFYFVVKPSTVEQALSVTPHPQIKLIKQYTKEHATNPDIRRRFKAIGIAENINNLGINIPMVRPLIDKFNGKPVIINKVATIYESAEPLDWFEVDISIFDFPYQAKTILSAIKDRVSEIILRAGFVIQGETDEELPELLLGGGDMCGLDFRLAKVI